MRYDTYSPIAPRPEYRKPQTSKAKAVSPDVKMPDVKKPEAKKPEIKMPEVKQPEVKKPEVKKPEVKKPEVKKPEIRRPEMKKPEVMKPEHKKHEHKKDDCECKKFCYDHWRYCEWCEKCQNEKDKHCHCEDDHKKDRCRKYDEYEEAKYFDEEDDQVVKSQRFIVSDPYEEDEPEDEEDEGYEDDEPEDEEDEGYEDDEPEDEDEEPEDEDDERYEEDEPEEAARYGRGNHGCKPRKQAHVHEFLGSTKLAEKCDERHNHRFAGVSGEAIKIPGGHVHKIWTRTDFFDHFHFICKLTGPAIPVDVDKEHDWDCKKKKKVEHHIHFVEGLTTFEDGHKHEFEVATLIEAPLLPQKDKDIKWY